MNTSAGTQSHSRTQTHPGTAHGAQGRARLGSGAHTLPARPAVGGNRVPAEHPMAGAGRPACAPCTPLCSRALPSPPARRRHAHLVDGGKTLKAWLFAKSQSSGSHPKTEGAGGAAAAGRRGGWRGEAGKARRGCQCSVGGGSSWGRGRCLEGSRARGAPPAGRRRQGRAASRPRIRNVAGPRTRRKAPRSRPDDWQHLQTRPGAPQGRVGPCSSTHRLALRRRKSYQGRRAKRGVPDAAGAGGGGVVQRSTAVGP